MIFLQITYTILKIRCSDLQPEENEVATQQENYGEYRAQETAIVEAIKNANYEFCASLGAPYKSKHRCSSLCLITGPNNGSVESAFECPVFQSLIILLQKGTDLKNKLKETLVTSLTESCKKEMEKVKERKQEYISTKNFEDFTADSGLKKYYSLAYTISFDKCEQLVVAKELSEKFSLLNKFYNDTARFTIFPLSSETNDLMFNQFKVNISEFIDAVKYLFGNAKLLSSNEDETKKYKILKEEACIWLDSMLEYTKKPSSTSNSLVASDGIVLFDLYVICSCFASKIISKSLSSDVVGGFVSATPYNVDKMCFNPISYNELESFINEDFLNPTKGSSSENNQPKWFKAMSLIYALFDSDDDNILKDNCSKFVDYLIDNAKDEPMLCYYTLVMKQAKLSSIAELKKQYVKQ